MDSKFWKGRRVFLTGHTGFKGGWIALWLSHMGAKVYGYSLAPLTTPSFFTETKLSERVERSIMGDIRDIENLKKSLLESRASVVIHMAAQPLVRKSYADPVETYSTNVMGTVNIFEAIRQTNTVKAVVNITTDKCYENMEWVWPYRENDRLGGYDPYSSSKSCAEIVSSAYRSSFLASQNIHLASVRAGNVIGGGDWSVDRLIPDFLRAIEAGASLKIRLPNAVRPWQHVLEPLSGYLILAEKLVLCGERYASEWNFGPDENDTKSVSWIADYLCSNLPNASWRHIETPQPHESGLLKLDSSKAKLYLGWSPKWNIEGTLDKTIEWHKAWKQGKCMTDFSIAQIEDYLAI